MNDRSCDRSVRLMIQSMALVSMTAGHSTIRPRTLARSHKQNLRSSTRFHPVRNGSAQLSYFIYSCTASNPTPSPHNSLPPSCARGLASKRALHPIHNVKQPKNKRRLDAFQLALNSFYLNRRKKMVGQGRFELPTSRLSSARSNQLSY